MMLVGVDGLRLLAADAATRRAAGCRSSCDFSCAVVRDAVREDVADRHFERDREDVEAGEHILAPACRRAPGMPPRSSLAQVDEIEDPLLVELIGIVELAGDDPPAVGQRRGCSVSTNA